MDLKTKKKPIPLNIYSHYSLLKSTLKIPDITKSLSEQELGCGALTDITNLAGSVQFIKESKSAGIKPILGLTLNLVDDAFIKHKDYKITRPLTLLARNFDGWKDLIKLHNMSHSAENFYFKPRIDMLKALNVISNSSNLIMITGKPGSDLANCLFTNLWYNDIDPNAEIRAKALCRQYLEYFGDRFYIEISIDKNRDFSTTRIAYILRKIADELNIKCVYSNPVHFSTKTYVDDCKLLLAIGAKKSLHQAKDACYDDLIAREIFKSDNFGFDADCVNNAAECEIAATYEIADRCEEYDITSKPKLPKFDCPDGLSEQDYLRELCRQGYKRKILGTANQSKSKEYADRVNYELGVIEKAGISGYFLIVQDYINAAKNRGELVGCSRGSSGGCLVAYLTNITEIDPLEYNLIFERFYNEGRNSPGNIHYPDIDTDFMKSRRVDTIEYISSKYGKDKVANICTFGRLQGRMAIKEVLRLTTNLTFDEINKITKPIPDESKIMDDLQEMREEEEEASIIGWAIENKKELNEFCRRNENGDLEGDLASEFAQAIRLEGIKKSQGQHASGIIISTDSLLENCPMVHANGNELIAGMDFKDLESMGYIKCDILGLAMLDKLYGIQQMINSTRTKEKETISC